MFERPIAAALVAACLTLGACDALDNVLASNTQANVRFANAMSGGSGTLTLGANGTAQGSGIAYQGYGACQYMSPGSTTFSYATTGSSTALATAPAATLSAGSRYTVIATGTASAPNTIVLTDDYSAPATGRARLRVINAVSGSLPFDVYVGSPGASLGTANQTSLAFNTSQSFLDVPAGQLQVSFTAAGTQTVLGTTGTITLSEGDVETVVVTPSATLGGLYTYFVVPSC